MFIMFSFEILRRKLVRGRTELTPFANDRRLNAVFVQLRIISLWPCKMKFVATEWTTPRRVETKQLTLTP